MHLDFTGQNRFEQLQRLNKTTAENLHSAFETQIVHKHNKMKKMAMDEYELLEHLKGEWMMMMISNYKH